MNNKIRIVIVDAHASFRHMLSTVLRKKGFIIKAALPGEPIAHVFYKDPPDIVIINYKTTDPSTIGSIRFVRQEYPSVRIVVTSLFHFHLPMEEFRQLGVEGIYIKSQMDGEQLVKLLKGL